MSEQEYGRVAIPERRSLAARAAARTGHVVALTWSPPALRAYGAILFWTWWIVFLVATLGYFVPWFIGWRRHIVNLGSVFVINLLAGWTLVGYVVAFAMAVRTRPPVST